MSSLREELTRTLLRLSRAGRSRPPEGRVAPEDTNYEGRRIGRYNVIKALGAGGMGHVYLAMDADMGRHVALKFLSPDLLDDPEMLRRLRTEGLTASSLNHPNILTIYEIGDFDGQQFIATEFVEGETLRTAMERDLIDLTAAVDIATQIASALVAAHAAGIVHRDLKPGNIMIREDGYVKVIDFGLAKRIRRSSRRLSKDLSMTRPGTIVGTVHYMAPEQASGGDVDGRSDIWSLGVILFELVTRRLPFDGKTETEVIDSIRDNSVPELSPGLGLPPGLDHVIRRALMKDPAERFQNARELLAALGAIHQPAVHHSPRPILVRRRRTPYWLLALMATTALFMLAALWHFALSDYLFGPKWFQIDKPRPLTFNGNVRIACLSPDGKYLAYAAGDREGVGVQTLYLLQLNTATEQIKIPARRETYYGLTFSPENEIFAVSEGRDLLGKLYVVPLVGDAPEKPRLVDIDGPVTFSPSGDRFAFVRYLHYVKAGKKTTENAVLVANRDGSGVHKVASTTNSDLDHRLAWSPISNQIAATYIDHSGSQGDVLSLHLLNLDGTSRAIPLPGWLSPGQPWWNDRQSLILPLTARAGWSGQSQLEQLDIRNGKLRDVTRDLASYKSVSLSADHNLLAAVKEESRGDLWVSEKGDFSRGQTASAELFTYPSLAWISPDRVMLNSIGGGFPNLWQFDVNANTKAAITSEPFTEQDAVAVPGSRSVILAANRSGQVKIWKFDQDTNTYTQLTFGSDYDYAPTVSSDGRWIVYTSWYATSSHLKKVPVAGGPSELLTGFPAKSAIFSPDGQQIACAAESHAGWAVVVFPFSHPELSRIVPDVALPIAWAPDGQTLHSVLTDTRGVSNVWSFPLDGLPPKRLTSFEDKRIVKFAWSPGGDRLACLRASFGSDACLFPRAN